MYPAALNGTEIENIEQKAVVICFKELLRN
jgi:hypothetical protein